MRGGRGVLRGSLTAVQVNEDRALRYTEKTLIKGISRPWCGFGGLISRVRLNVGLVRDHSVNYWGREKRNIRRQGCCWWNNFPPLFSTMAINRVSVPSPDGQKWREFKWLHVSSVPRDVLWWPAPWLFWDCFISLSFFALPWKLVRCFRNSSTLTAKLYFQFCRFPKGS